MARHPNVNDAVVRGAWLTKAPTGDRPGQLTIAASVGDEAAHLAHVHLPAGVERAAGAEPAG
jgi:hypothetical protein